MMLITNIEFVYAYPTDASIGVKKVIQERTLWCWDACSVAVLDHYGINVSQNDFCTVVKGNVVNETATTAEVSTGLNHYGIDSKVISSGLSFSAIRAQVYNYDRPMIMCWIWNSGGGHMMVLEGYSIDSTNYVSYMDPYDGQYHISTYSYVSNGYDHDWAETIYNFRQ